MRKGLSRRKPLADDPRRPGGSVEVERRDGRSWPGKHEAHLRGQKLRRDPLLRQHAGEIELFEPCRPRALFGLATRGKGDEEARASGTQNVAHGVVAGLRDGKAGTAEQATEIPPETKEADALWSRGRECVEIRLRQVRAGYQTPAKCIRQKLRGLERRADQLPADRASARRNDDVELLGRLIWRRRSDEARIDDLVADFVGKGKCLLDTGESGVTRERVRGRNGS